MPPDLAQTLSEASGREKSLFYLDANVLIDLVRPRRPSSRQFVDESNNHSFGCTTSTFAIMEALDVEQENRWAAKEIRIGRSFDQLLRQGSDRRLTTRMFRNVYRSFVSEVYERQEIEIFSPDVSIWEDAMQLAVETTSFAPDCIHVAAALSHSCNVLVSWDQQLRRTASGRIEVATPEEVLSSLRATSQSGAPIP